MADIYFDVDTALSEVPVNIFPLTDDTDYKTRETSVAYNATGMDLVWNFVTTAGAFTQTAVTPTTGGSYDWTHQGDGMYSIEIPASSGASINNDTEGFGWFTGVATGVMPWRSPIYGFRAAGINDKLIDSAYDTARGLAGTALPAAASDAAGGLPISDAGGLDLDTKLANTNEITSTRMGYLDAAISTRSTLTASDVWGYATRTLSSFGSLVSDIATAVWGATTRTLSAFGFSVTASSVSDKTGYSLSVTPPTASEIADAVLDEALSGHTTSGTLGERIATIITNIAALNNISTSQVLAQVTSALNSYDVPTKAELDSAVSPLATSSALSAVAGYVDTEVASIKAVTDDLAGMLETDGAVKKFTVNALENAPSGGAGGGDATAANQTIIIGHLTDIKGSTFSGSTDSLEAIRDRGDVAWLTGSGASGSNTATLTIHDTDDNNLIDVAVEIWDSAGTSFIERKNSNSSGISVFNLDDGTYTVKCHKAFYSFTNTTITVSGNLSHTIEGIAFVIPVPTNPDLCRVYCGLDDGITFPTSASSEYQISGNFEIDNTYFSTFEKIGVYNSTTGLLYFDLPQGSTVIIDIPGYISGTYIIPASASARLKDLTTA